jgi:hypothetical protein
MTGAFGFRFAASLAALPFFLAGAPAFAGSVEVRCAGMPAPVRADLASRLAATIDATGTRWSTLGVECDGYGVWIVWFDGSRALVDQTAGLVPGAVALVESRVSFDRSQAASMAVQPVPDTPARPDLEVPPNDPVVEPDTTKSERKTGTEGGIGLGMTTAFWGSSATGIGPRLDVGVGPPGAIAFLLSESALFGTGAANSSQITMFDFQAGVAFGAPYKVRTGFGGVALLGAERITAANSRSDSSGAWEWDATLDLGARGGLKWSGVNVWLGADLMIRSSRFDLGGTTPVSIPTSTFMLSLGGFVPAFARRSSSD